MTTQPPTTRGTAPSSMPKKKRFGRKLAVIAGVLVLLLVVAYFVVTSGPFIKSVVVPQVASALNASITLEEASLSPFSQVRLQGLSLHTTGDTPLLTAKEVRARYSLWSIVRGTIRVEEVLLDSPAITLIYNADGTSNLDPLLASSKQAPPKPSPPPTPAPAKPLQLDLKKVSLVNATVRRIQHGRGGLQQIQELSQANLTVSDLKNGQTGHLEWSIELRQEIKTGTNAPNARLAAQSTGSLALSLTPDLKPGSAQGQARLAVTTAEGTLKDLANAQLLLDCQMTPTQIDQLSLAFKKGDATLGQIRLSGPFNASQAEGQVDLAITGIDRQALSLVGAATGLDFGNTRVDSTNRLILSKAGKALDVSGRLAIAQASLTQQGRKSPTLDLNTDYRLALDQAGTTAVIHSLTLAGRQNQKPILQATLSQPMTLAWGAASNAIGDSKLQLVLTNLDLAEWNEFARPNSLQGHLHTSLDVLSTQSGKRLALTLATRLENLSVQSSSNRLEACDLALHFQGEASEMRNLNIQGTELTLSRQGRQAFKATLRGPIQLQTFESDLEAELQGDVPQLTALAPQPGTVLTQGNFTAKAHLTRKAESFIATVQAALQNLHGTIAGGRLQNYATALDLEARLKGAELQLPKAVLSIASGGQPGGHIAAQGHLNQDKYTGQFSLSLSNLNERAAAPFVEPFLAGKSLVKLSLHGTNLLTLDGKDKIGVQSELDLANLTVQGLGTNASPTPLQAKLQFTAGVDGAKYSLEPCTLSLTPTARAKNQIQAQAKLDGSVSNAWQGQLSVIATTLDLTPYADLVLAQSNATVKASTPKPPPQPAPSQPPFPTVEPAPVTLPCKDLTFDLRVTKLFLRDLTFGGIQVKARATSNHFVLSPCQLTCQDRPITASADLSLDRPGFAYDFGLRVDHVPVDPFVSSFAPEYQSQAKGNLVTDVRITGAGVTAPNLQKNLEGYATLGFTNAYLLILSPQAQQMIAPIAALLRIQELATSPLNWMNASLNVGKGRLQITRLALLGEAFSALSQGTINLTPQLTNSPLPDLPVHFALRRSIAEKSNLMPEGTPPESPYVMLPDFIHIGGTLGTPETKVNKLVLAGLLAKSTAGLGPIVGDKGASFLQGVGNLLTRPTTPQTNAPASKTNAPPPATPSPTNAPKRINPLDLLNPPK